jgi:integrase
MKQQMKNRYRLFKRGWGVYYAFNNETGNSESLHTRDKAEATRLVHAMNEAGRMTAMNTQIARAYLTASDPEITKRTWWFVHQEIKKLKAKGAAVTTQKRWDTVEKDEALEPLFPMALLETRAEHILKAIEAGTVSTNVFLRRLHNFAVGMGWLPWPLLPKKMWPKVVYQPKRAITQEEHRRIIEREKNPERRTFYELCWHLGGSQSDIACLTTENIDRDGRTICYSRKKMINREGQAVPRSLIRYGDKVDVILETLPKSGPLFPHLRHVAAKDRATEFGQRCQGLDIEGVTLHSYRYAWAERARKCGYPERYAQEALGQNCKAVHTAYAKNAEVVVPSLDEWERQMKEKVVEFKAVAATPLEQATSTAPVAAVS